MIRFLPLALASAVLLSACGTAPSITRSAATSTTATATQARFDESLGMVMNRAQWDARRWDMSAELGKATANWVQTGVPSVDGWLLVYTSPFKQTMLVIEYRNGFMQSHEVPRDAFLRPVFNYGGMTRDLPDILKLATEAGLKDRTLYRVEAMNGPYCSEQWTLEAPSGWWIVDGATGRVIRKP